MSIDSLRVEMGKIFENGQAYVALSRATTLEGLTISNLDPKKICCDPKVVEFYKSLK